jgi:hypothetical protein
MNWLFQNSTIKAFTLLLVAALLSCGNSEENDEPQAQDDEPYVKGTVVDAKGNPLAGVSIIIDNTIFGNTYVTATTNGKGEYKVRVPNVGAWIVYAKYTFQYAGQEYEMYMRPDSSEGFIGNEQITRNFTWELTGRKPLPLSGHFGGSIEIVKGIGSMIFDPQNIVFTFTPTAPLIDGSTGEVITTRCDSNNMIEDIPMGKYRITADYHSEDGIIRLGLSDFFTQSEFEQVLELPFSPHTHLCDNCMILQYKEL